MNIEADRSRGDCNHSPDMAKKCSTAKMHSNPEQLHFHDYQVLLHACGFGPSCFWWGRKLKKKIYGWLVLMWAKQYVRFIDECLSWHRDKSRKMRKKSGYGAEQAAFLQLCSFGLNMCLETGSKLNQSLLSRLQIYSLKQSTLSSVRLEISVKLGIGHEHDFFPKTASHF